MFYSGFNVGDKVRFRSGLVGLRRWLAPFGYVRNGVFVVMAVEDTKDCQVVTLEGITCKLSHHLLKRAWKYKN